MNNSVDGVIVIQRDVDNLVICFLITVFIQLAFYLVACTCKFDKLTDFAGGGNFVVLAAVPTFGLSGVSPRSTMTCQLLLTTCLAAALTSNYFSPLVSPFRAARNEKLEAIPQHILKGVCQAQIYSQCFLLSNRPIMHDRSSSQFLCPSGASDWRDIYSLGYSQLVPTSDLTMYVTIH